MKLLKYFLSAILIVTTIWSCTDDEFGSLDFLSTATAPTNGTAFVNVTQDNTGTVTITPNGEGATFYEVYFGDNTASPAKVNQGGSVTHVYNEGSYDVRLVSTNITGLKSETVMPIVVSFKAPMNLEVVIENDKAVSKQVNVTVKADYGLLFDVYFGEAGNDVPVSANMGGTASYIYKVAGKYTIRVVAKSAAIKTTEQTQEFTAVEILQPTSSASIPDYRAAANYISIYSSAYTNVVGTNFNPDWGQSGQGSGFAEFNLNGDKMLQYINLSYQGIALADGLTIDVSGMEFLHMDVWTAKVTQLETSLISKTNGEKPVTRNLTAGEWTSIELPISEFTSQGLTVKDIIQLKLVGTPWAGGTVFVDNIYFYKTPAPASGLEGTWKLAPEAGALKVGPAAGNGDWWSSSLEDVTLRSCYFDDTYVFNTDGSFKNELGGSTWLEAWQGTADACGTPVAPHNGAAATYLYDKDAGTLKVTGKGAYVGLPKVNNAGELPNVAVPNAITYKVALSNNDNVMTVSVEAGSGVFWTYKLVR